MLRRTFVKAVGSGTLAVIGGRILDGGRVVGPWTRGFEEALAAAETPLPLLLHNNENPLGPGEKALNAIREKLVERGVPAARYTSLAPDLAAMIAARYKCKEENVLVGCGSTQILRTATLLFTSPERPLVAGSPAYEECGDVAKLAGAPIKTVAGTSTLHHDLDGMAAAAKGAGLIYFDNPSNPAATLHPANAVATFVERVTREAGDTHIIIDEAYHDYVTDPAHHTQIPLAIDHPRVIVARTFSKAFGMAGLRVGYAIARAETIKKMRRNPLWARDQRSGACGGNGILSRRDASRPRSQTEYRSARVHDQLVQECRLHANGLAVQLHLREHRTDGKRVPRRVCQSQRPRRPRLSAI